MLITHHPLLFSAVKKVTDEDFITRRIVKLIQNDISYYAMHTNYDVLGMAELAGKVLDIAHTDVLDVTQTDEVGEEKGIGRIGELPETMTLEECCVYVKHKLELGSLKVFGDMNRPVRRLAILPGSGKSSIPVALAKGADVLVTGDIGHHDGLDAVEQGLAIIHETVSEQKITGTGCVDRSGRTSISDRLNYAGGGGRWKSLYAE